MAKGSRPDQTDVKIVYYEKSSHCLQASPTFLENARKISSYMKDIMSRDPIMEFKVITPFTNTARDSLIDSVIDDMQGYYMKSKQFQIVDWIKIISVLVILGATISLFAIGRTVEGILVAAIDAGFALLELPDILMRRS